MHKASVAVVFGREHETRRIRAPHLRLILGGLANHKPEPDECQGPTVPATFGHCLSKSSAFEDPSATPLQFKKWLALFFIERGTYKITDKGYEELAPDIERLDTHFGEDNSAKERSTKGEVARPLTRKELREAVNSKVEQMLRDGKAEELYDKAYLVHKSDWKNKETRVAVIKKFVELSSESPREITKDDFNNNGLGGLIDHYKCSPYLALVEAGYAYSFDETKEHARTGFKTDKIYPWEMSGAPLGFYKKSENRIAATKWLVWRLDKNPRELTKDDFKNNGLGGLIDHYKCSPYLALVEADYAYSLDEIKEHARTGFKTDKIYPWEMNNVRIYEDKQNRIAACKWLIWKLNKEAREITVYDFNNNGLSGLITNHYKDSPYIALVEAGYVYSLDEIKEHSRTGFKTDKIYPWELNQTPNRIWPHKENRIFATKWLIWKLNKNPREITGDDFNNNGLSGLLARPEYNCSPYKALLEADLVTQADETYMRKRLHIKLGNLVHQSDS